MRKRSSKPLKWAIYIERGKQCIHCEEPVKFNEIQVDHLIPISLLDKPNELADLLDVLDLPESFDLNGIPNLAPSHSRCNRLKHAKISGNTLLQMHIQNGLALEPKILKKCRQYEEDFVKAYFARFPNFERMEDESLTGRLSLPITFENMQSDEFHQLDELHLLFDAVIESPVIDLEDADGNINNVSTLNSYIQAVNDGFVPTCNMMGKQANSYQNAIKILLAYQTAQPPLETYISYPRVGVCDIELMPSSTLFFGEYGGTKPDLSPKKAVESGYITNPEEFRIDMISSNRLVYWYPHLHDGRWYQEIARFDFTGSGYEEMLVIEGYFCEGTLSFSDVVIITRDDPDAGYTIQPFIPEEQSNILGKPNPFVDY